MANTSGEKELKTEWPIESGLEVNQRHHGRATKLIPAKSVVLKEEKVGL